MQLIPFLKNSYQNLGKFIRKGDRMVSFIDDETIEEVKETSDIVEIVSDYVNLKKSGANFKGLCPFHNEKTPSFTVSDSKQFFHCFGCGEGGDSISFIMKIENLEFIDAIKLLADRYGIEIKGEKIDDKLLKEREVAYKINRDSARFFYNNLSKSKEALNYLKNRKIDIKTINKFGLGYALDSWDNLYNYLVGKGYKEEDIEKIGLIAPRRTSGYYDKFRNRIIFPIIDTRSRVIGFGGRVIDDSMPKYLNSQESIIFDKSNSLYGLNLVNKYSDREKILLVEGYMDVIALFSKGINYSVASLGTSLTERQGRLLKRFGKEVYICFDSDKAGIRASLRAIDILLKIDVKPRLMVLPKKMDPDDYINKYGLIEFEKLFLESYNYIDYKIRIIKNKYNLDEIEDKIEFTTEVGDLIKGLDSSIEQDVYIRKISEDTGISIEAIEKEIKSRSKRKKRRFTQKPYRSKEKDISPVDSEITPGSLKAELDLLRLSLEDKDYYIYINKNLSKDDFSSKECREIFKLIKEEYKLVDSIDREDIIKKAKEKAIYTDIFKTIINMEIKYDATNIEASIKDLINRIIYENLARQRSKILKKIKAFDKGVEVNQKDDELKNLFIELTQLNNKINLLGRNKEVT